MLCVCEGMICFVCLGGGMICGGGVLFVLCVWEWGMVWGGGLCDSWSEILFVLCVWEWVCFFGGGCCLFCASRFVFDHKYEFSALLCISITRGPSATSSVHNLRPLIGRQITCAVTTNHTTASPQVTEVMATPHPTHMVDVDGDEHVRPKRLRRQNNIT